MTERALDKYFIKKTYMYYNKPIYIEHGLLDTFEPVTIPSVNYKNWRAILDIKTCIECRSKHGQIFQINEIVEPEPPLHNNCRCNIIPMESILAGNATKNGDDGADYWLKTFGKLRNIISQNMGSLLWAGVTVKSLLNLRRGKCIQKESIII